MEYNSSENPIEKIEFIISSLIDFSSKNEFDFSIYKSFAEESGKSFNRYFAQIKNNTDQVKIISDLKTDFHFIVADIAIKSLGRKNAKIDNFEEGVTYYIAEAIPDNRIRGYESNYKQLIELFLNSVQFETLTEIISTKEPLDLDTSVIEKGIMVIKEKHGSMFSNNGFELFEHILSQYVKKNRGRLSDIHYFYWVMFNHENKYIHQRPESFKTWFYKTYNEDLGKIKTINNVKSPDRDKHFSNALDWFKTQNQ
jgi:hypothetical protein